MLQKMLQKKQSNLTIQSIKTNQGVSICNQLNLDIENLNNQELMMNSTYRRLYNIVKNDMSRSDFHFRKNLIKELYFLLQIMPIIKPQNKELFIMEIQKLYNLNDHKKIELASNKLNKILKDVHNNANKQEKDIYKQQTNPSERPKSGVEWNQKISPFLRPYTAQRPPNKSSSKNKQTSRPQSSKFGNKSTKNQTVAQSQDIYIRQFTTNIQEEFQISKDFMKGHRTIHPTQEPIYEQLYNIFKKIQTSPNEPQEQKPTFSRTQTNKYLRYTKSAVTRKPIKKNTQNNDQNDKKSHAQYQNRQSFQATQNNDQINLKKQQYNNDSGSNSDSNSEQQEYIYVNDKKEKKAYLTTPNINELAQQKIGVNQIEKLDKHYHVIQNRLVQAIKEDNQMAIKYIDFAKGKSFKRKQLNRRAQSKRLMSAKTFNPKYIKLTKQSSQDDEAKQNFIEGKTKFYDFSSFDKFTNKINPYPTYNRNNFFKKTHREEVKTCQKDIFFGKAPQKLDTVKAKMIRPMTAFVRFNEAQRFDPFSEENIKKHNEQALQQIQKIKVKVGGKLSASTQSLMKVLYIDAHQKIENTKWEEKNPCFGLISIGKKPKKLKKRGRKLNKSSKNIQITKRK